MSERSLALRSCVVLWLVASAALGCSISDSVSKSVSSPFEWSSASAEGGSASYQSDVSDYTVAYVKSSNDVTAFQNGIASVASKHGITNWQASEATWRGVGEGLGRAHVTPTQLEVYKANLASGSPGTALAIQQGYQRTYRY